MSIKIILLYIVSFSWLILGVMIFLGAWMENKEDYEEHFGELSDDIKFTIETPYNTLNPEDKPQITRALLHIDGKPHEYQLRGILYHKNSEGVNSLKKGDHVKLMVKKTNIIGGAKVSKKNKSRIISAISRSNGEVIISLDDGIKQSKKRLIIAALFVFMGLGLLIWTFFRK